MTNSRKENYFQLTLSHNHKNMLYGILKLNYIVFKNRITNHFQSQFVWSIVY